MVNFEIYFHHYCFILQIFFTCQHKWVNTFLIKNNAVIHKMIFLNNTFKTQKKIFSKYLIFKIVKYSFIYICSFSIHIYLYFMYTSFVLYNMHNLLLLNSKLDNHFKPKIFYTLQIQMQKFLHVIF